MPDGWRCRLESLPLVPPPDPGGRVLVVSAHPDDEVLAVGGWLAEQSDREVVFVTATDGEASHPSSSSITPDELRARRPGELLRALSHLGFERPDVRRLRLPDGELDRRRDDLRQQLQPLVLEADLVLCPFEQDGHPDHDAIGEVVVDLCAEGVVLWRFPVWTWAWTRPGDQPWMGEVRRLDTTSVARHRKRRAISAFTTQVRPVGDGDGDRAVLEDALLRHARLAPEAVVV